MDSDALHQVRAVAKYIQADYINDFQCDGKLCGCRCCRDWQIAVDEGTRENFLTLGENERAEIFRRLEEVDGKLFLRMTAEGACEFLGEDSLCSLQKKHGENFLTATCQSFPRVTYKLDEDFFEQSMTLTCPIAAKMILLRENPITFEEVEGLNARAIIGFKKNIFGTAEEFFARQMNSIKILQDRNFAISRRLENLFAMYGEKLNPELDAESLTEIFVGTYKTNLNAEKKKVLADNYSTSREKILEQLQKNFPHFLENYLVNEFFMRCHPAAFEGGEINNLKIFAAAFNLLEFIIVLNVTAKGRLLEEDLITLICAVNDKLDHSKGGMDTIIDMVSAGKIF